jgi:hypothetical protein
VGEYGRRQGGRVVGTLEQGTTGAAGAAASARESQIMQRWEGFFLVIAGAHHKQVLHSL